MATDGFWRWEITDPATGKRLKTRHRMHEADALATDQTATRIAGTIELRDLVDQPRSQSTGDFVKPTS